MNDPAFFGYGSLVNLATHDYANPRPATLRGWRRVWQSTDIRAAAFLSVIPHPSTTLDGVIAQVPDANWDALDKREAAYARHDVSAAVGQMGTAVYQVKPQTVVAGQHAPILLSYLDVVVQGYYRMFGADGVARFFATTDGWHAPILDDRDAPSYPRHQQLLKSERALVDHHLAAVMQQAE